MPAAARDLAQVDLLDYDLFEDHEPWEVFELLQRDAPVHFHPERDGRGFWAVTKYADVHAVLRDTRTFSSEVGGSATIEDLPDDVLEARRNLLEYDPPRHGQYRRLISTSFTPGAVERYTEWLYALVTALMDRALPKGELDLVEELAAPIPIRVLARLLGLPDDELPQLVELGDRLLVDTDPEFVGDLAYTGEREEDRYKPFGSPWADELCELGRRHYAERRECPRDDVLTRIATAEIDGRPLSPRELDNMFALMIVAGNETTRQAIALGTKALAEHPAEYARLRADRSLLEPAVDELLRFSSPVWFFRRTATADTTVGGQEIKAGDKVVVWFAAGNRDPDKYPDPHRLDLGRAAKDHLTFGRGGPHQCLGMHLARLELKVYLEELVERVERVELAGPPVRLRSNFTNGLKRLPVRVTPA